MICPTGKSMTFHKKETEKIELVTILGEDFQNLQHDGTADGVVAGPRALGHGIEVTVDQKGVFGAMVRLNFDNYVL